MIVVKQIRPTTRARRHSTVDPILQAFLAGNGMESGRGRYWRPRVEVFETQAALDVVVELAGMDGEAIDIGIDGDVLTIEGERRDPHAGSPRVYHVANIGYGPFAVDIRLPFAVEADNAEARYENGFLSISLPRAQTRTVVPVRNDARNVMSDEENNA